MDFSDQLKLPQAKGIREVVIMSESGTVLKKTKPSGKIVSLRGLPNGSYLMKIVTADQVYTQKFVKVSK